MAVTLRWRDVATLYQPTLGAHARACAEAGLSCPLDVFEQLFFDPYGDHNFAACVESVDWAGVSWDERALSGLKLRQVSAPPDYRYAVDEARSLTAAAGISDDRSEVVAAWKGQGTWTRWPILVEGALLGVPLEYVMLVGFTRFGNLLGLLDRQEISEFRPHRVWVGRRKWE